MSEIASLIDHTILRADATRHDVLKTCEEARAYGFASVCVNPYWVPLVSHQLVGTSVKVCTVIAFRWVQMRRKQKPSKQAARSAWVREKSTWC